MATKVTLTGVGGPLSVSTHSVYTKAKWSDDWTLQPHLHCDEAAWSVAPSIPTAMLHWYYGSIAQPGQLQFATVARKSLLRAYVKIVFGTDTIPKIWHGIIEVEEDDLDGARVWTDSDGTKHVLPTGEQAFSAYGLEQLLANHTISTTIAAAAGGYETIGRGLRFNDRGKPNRDNGAIAFAYTSANVDHWSSREIVNYLLARQTPHASNDSDRITWILPWSSASCIPDWDRPQLDQHMLTTYDMLSSLISRQRLLSWYLTVDETPSPPVVNLMVDTATASPVILNLPDATPIPANTKQKHLIFDADNSARAALKTSAIEHFDQFIVLGARRRSVFSVGFDDATLAVGWTGAAEDTYEEAATYAAGLPAGTELTARRKLHAEARTAEEVKDVFVRFVIPETWDGKVGAGDGTTSVLPAFPIVKEDGSIENEPAPFYRLGITVDQSMPLLEDVKYDGDKVPDGTVDESDSSGVERTPMVFWKLPGTTPQRWQNVETIGRKADLETEDPDEIQDWSCEVSVPPHDRGVRLHVHGAPQEILAKTDFSGTPEDDVIGDHDYRDMICTLSVTEDRHATGVYPADNTLDPLADFIRRKFVDAGDNFRQDYLCPATIVDVDKDGALVRSNGGFLRDDTAELVAIARVAWEWYGRDRKVLSLSSEVLTGSLSLGDLIEQIGDDSVPGEGHNLYINSVVTEIRISTRRQEGFGEPDPPRMLITTGWGELDPLQLLGPEDAPKDASRPKDIMVTPFDFSRGV